jgi:predicted methyltransferase
MIACALSAAAFGQPVAPADGAAPAIIPYEARNPQNAAGDRLAEPRRLAAAVAAQWSRNPRKIVDVGSFTGEYLEAFLERFAQAKGQWTEPVDTNRTIARRRFERFTDRVDYVVGCPGRDISLGCIPADTDILISSWLTIHRDLDGVRAFHRAAFRQLPSGGVVAIIDHAGGNAAWRAVMATARKDAVGLGLAAAWEGPPVHHPEFSTPTSAQQVEAMRNAGFTDVTVLWTRLDTFLYIGRKP